MKAKLVFYTLEDIEYIAIATMPDFYNELKTMGGSIIDEVILPTGKSFDCWPSNRLMRQE